MGKARIVAKQKIDFRYDFSDDWRFVVLVEKIAPPNTIEKPTVIEKRGEAPEQYAWD
ncbi:MAG: hypothetical protein HY777_10655 [Betaproteobacteria bacterium]|nr:hypothetical protein [Betaproteobacteria bacterium]